jgi:hypothetical protein
VSSDVVRGDRIKPREIAVRAICVRLEFLGALLLNIQVFWFITLFI